MNVTIIPCIGSNCTQKLRVPWDKGMIRITCPTCKLTWQWEPNPNAPTETLRAVEFRCAHSGKLFSSTFKRAAFGRIFYFVPPAETNAPTKALSLAIGSDSGDSDWRKLLHASIDQRAATANQTEEMNISEFDFDGWSCAECDSNASKTGSEFVRCGKCNYFVCSGRVTVEPDGSSWFRCYDSCGKSGKIGGTIKSVDSRAAPSASTPVDKLSAISHESVPILGDARGKGK
jgi:hypothetical protein